MLRPFLPYTLLSHVFSHEFSHEGSFEYDTWAATAPNERSITINHVMLIRLLLYVSVNWYQRNYPYAWVGARLVRDAN